MGLILLIAGAAALIIRAYNAVRNSDQYDPLINTTRTQAGVVFQLADVALRILDVLVLARVARPNGGGGGAQTSVQFGRPHYQAVEA